MSDLVWPVQDPDANTSRPPDRYGLRLFISGATPRSVQAVRNIKLIGEQHLVGNYDLEVIDVYQQPALAREQDIVALPTLVKYFPLPARRIIGDLSDIPHVIQGLGLQAVE